MPAASAIASTVVASKPRSAKSSRATRSSSEREVTGGRPGADVDFDTGCNYYRKLIADKGSSMANAWFETVAEAQRRAKKRLPAPVYGALMAGQESRSEEHTSELQSLMRTPYAFFCLKKKKQIKN